MTHSQFIEHYEKYLIGDIEAMMQKADQDSTGNQMAIPITFSIFSCLDIFGFLIRNNETEHKKIELQLKNSSVNIAYAILKFDCFGFPTFDLQSTPDKSNNQILFDFITIFRHGTMHTFFPKAFGISNSLKDDSYKLFYASNEKLTFNVRKFYSYFKDFIEKFKEELSSNRKFANSIQINIDLFLVILNNDNSITNFKEKICEIDKLIYRSPPSTTTIQTTTPPNSENMNITGSFSQN